MAEWGAKPASMGRLNSNRPSKGKNNWRKLATQHKLKMFRTDGTCSIETHTTETACFGVAMISLLDLLQLEVTLEATNPDAVAMAMNSPRIFDRKTDKSVLGIPNKIATHFQDDLRLHIFPYVSLLMSRFNQLFYT